MAKILREWCLELLPPAVTRKTHFRFHVAPSRRESADGRSGRAGLRLADSVSLAVLLALLLWGSCGAVTAAKVHAQRHGSPPGFSEQGGAAIYHGICQGCHMPNAKGACAAGCYPALAENAALGAPDFAVRVVVNGAEGMPAFGTMLSDQQIADVMNYIRTQFGNHYPATITPAQVRGARRTTETAGESE
jgi:mono/diheme cytochrome c family protein